MRGGWNNFVQRFPMVLLQYEHNWDIESNIESGLGYSDILIRTENRIGIAIEIKYAADGNLKKSCEDSPTFIVRVMNRQN